MFWSLPIWTLKLRTRGLPSLGGAEQVSGITEQEVPTLSPTGPATRLRLHILWIWSYLPFSRHATSSSFEGKDSADRNPWGPRHGRALLSSMGGRGPPQPNKGRCATELTPTNSHSSDRKTLGRPRHSQTVPISLKSDKSQDRLPCKNWSSCLKMNVRQAHNGYKQLLRRQRSSFKKVKNVPPLTRIISDSGGQLVRGSRGTPLKKLWQT